MIGRSNSTTTESSCSNWMSSSSSGIPSKARIFSSSSKSASHNRVYVSVCMESKRSRKCSTGSCTGSPDTGTVVRVTQAFWIGTSDPSERVTEIRS